MIKRMAVLAAFFIGVVGVAVAQDVKWSPVGAWPLCPAMPFSPWCPVVSGSETYMLLIKASSPLPVAFTYEVEGTGPDGSPHQFSGIVKRADIWSGYTPVTLMTGVLRDVKITVRELSVTGEWNSAPPK